VDERCTIIFSHPSCFSFDQMFLPLFSLFAFDYPFDLCSLSGSYGRSGRERHGLLWRHVRPTRNSHSCKRFFYPLFIFILLFCLLCQHSVCWSSASHAGYSGSLHQCHNPNPEDASGWRAEVTTSGHNGGVMDMCWDRHQNYLLSTSTDQKTRLFARWVHNPNSRAATWHEIARPQTHGYDLNCITPMSTHLFASGADEKVVRVFFAPEPFVKRLALISECKTDPPNEKNEEDPANMM
jgi:hypothetical protein